MSQGKVQDEHEHVKQGSAQKMIAHVKEQHGLKGVLLAKFEIIWEFKKVIIVVNRKYWTINTSIHINPGSNWFRQESSLNPKVTGKDLMRNGIFK